MTQDKGNSMFDHIGVVVSDYAKSKAFYAQALAPVPEEKIDDALRATLARVVTHDLAQVSTPSEDGDASGGTRVVDVDVARQFVDRLRALPRSDADTFLQEFKIERLRDLPNDRVPAALQLLMKLEASHKSATAVDPFAV
jgi:catechol 2,3-dioxygenase-like lactoylglutathione lyase family enzyme